MMLTTFIDEAELIEQETRSYAQLSKVTTRTTLFSAKSASDPHLVLLPATLRFSLLPMAVSTA